MLMFSELGAAETLGLGDEPVPEWGIDSGCILKSLLGERPRPTYTQQSILELQITIFNFMIASNS